MADIPVETLREAGADGGGFLGWYARGHWPRYDFHHEVCHGYDVDQDDRRWFRPGDVKIGWWRSVPMSQEEGGEPGDRKWVDAEPESRGAFKVTFVDIEEMRLERHRATWKQYRDDGFRAGTNFTCQWLEQRGLGEHVPDLVTAVREHLAGKP